jgi:translocation and assembly module TamB
MYGFGGTVLGLVGVIAVAGTGPVLRMATPMINEAVSAATDSEFALGEIEGSVWSGLSLDHLTMDRAADGLHVALEDVAFDWSPSALLGGRLQIDRVALASANVILPDGTAPETVEKEDEDGGGFSIPLAVSLEALNLDEIAIVDQVTGKSFLYTLKGRAKVGTNLSATAFLDLQPLDGGTDQVKLDLDFDGPAQRLAAEIDGTLGREGLVMTLAGVDPASATDIKIALNGDGPAKDWKGTLDLSAAGYASLASDIGVQLSSDVATFALDGAVSPQERLSEQLPAGLDHEITLGIGGAFDQAEQTVSFDRISIAMADALSLSGMTVLDLDENQITADVSADLDPKMSALLDEAVSWSELGLTVQANGDMAMPGVSLRVNGRDVKTPMSQIANVAVQADMTAPDDAGDVDEQLDATIAVSATGTEWDDPALGAMLGTQQDLSLYAEMSQDFADISVRNLVLKVPDMTVSGQADVNEDMVVTTSDLVADIRDLAIFGPISGLDLSGQGKVALPDLTWSGANGLETGIEVSASRAGFGVADLDRIVGPEPRITGKVILAPDLDLKVDVAAIDTAMINGPLMLRITEAFEKLSLESTLDIAAGVVPPDLGIEMAPAKLTADLEGDLAAPAGTVEVRTPTLDVSGQKFSDIVLTSRMIWSDQAVLSLANNGKFTFANEPYQLDARLVLPEDALRVEAISLEGQHIVLGGDIALPDYSIPMRGDITLSKFDAEFLDRFGVGFVNGAITGNVALRPGNQGQKITANVSAKGLRMPSADGANPTMIEDVELSATIGNAFEAPEITATLEGRDITAGSVALKTVALDVDGGLDALTISLESSGLYQGNVPISTDLAADLSLGNDIAVTANRLEANVGDQAISLRKPLEVVLRENGRQQLEADLTVGSGHLVANLDQEAGQKSISGELHLNDFDLGPWGRISGFDGLSGTANLDASLRETRGNLPSAQVDGRISGIAAKAVAGLKPFEMKLDITLADGELAGEASLGNGDVETLTAKGNVPLAISVLEQEFSPDLGAPVSARVRLNGEIAEFWPYVPAPDHQMSGKIKLALDVAGTLDDIRWNGDLALADGRYENLEYGTILDQIALEGTFDQAGLSIPSITATDGGKGTVNASVDLDLPDGGDMRYDVSADLRNVAVSRKDELQFWADVKASVTGSQSEADIQSTVSVLRGEVDLTLALPESVPTIEIQNLPDASQAEKAEKDGEDENAFTGNLDVTVDIPGKLFVRGKGLDSEWGGRLEIAGTTDDPRITGQLSALRGQLDIIGKTFVIRDSQITFAGASPPDPMLDIKGVYTTEDLVVTAGFQGPSSDPELVLTSNPSLPEDEILSQVLFGKSQGSLSAVEAVQLASALNELSGGGSGLDVVGSIRRFIGADVLRVGGGEDGPEVKVGKYLAEGVYVGTKAGSTPGSSGVEVEIEVTPNISVTSESTEIDSKAGIQYRLDY